VNYSNKLLVIYSQSALERLESEDGLGEKTLLNVQNQLLNLKNKESRLLDAYLSQSIEKDVYDAKQEEIKKDRIALELNIKNQTHKYQNPREAIERTKKLFLDSNKAKPEYLEAVPERKREIAYEVLSNALLTNKIMAQPQLKSPYDMLARTPKNADILTMCG
jgi:signal recognition particle subunit SEC65